MGPSSWGRAAGAEILGPDRVELFGSGSGGAVPHSGSAGRCPEDHGARRLTALQDAVLQKSSLPGASPISGEETFMEETSGEENTKEKNAWEENTREESTLKKSP